MLDDIPNNFKTKFPNLNEGNVHAKILNILTEHLEKKCYLYLEFIPMN